MKRLISIIMLLVFIISTTGCATTGQNGQPSASESAGMGALMGAAGGALLGFLATGDAKGAIKGAAIGAVAGGLTGFVIGKSREKQYKTAEQIYQQKPQLAAKSAKNNPPTVAEMKPVIFNKNGKPVGGIKNGEWVELGMDYQIEIPKYSETRRVDVIEYNTLIAPNGTRMKNPELRRTTTRPCGAVESAIQVQIPPKLPEGKYTHLASVTIGNKEYKKETQVQIVKSNGEIKIYAANRHN